MSALSLFWRVYGGAHFRALLAMSLISNLLILAPSFHMLQVYDRVLNSGSMATLFYITLIAVFALCVYGVVETIRGRIATRLAAKYTIAVARKLFARFAQMPQGTSAAGQYLRDYSQVRAFLGSRVFVGLFDVPFIPFFLLLLFLVHWTIGLLTLIGIIAMIAISAANSFVSEASRSAGQRADSEAMGFAQAAFAREEDVRSLGLLPSFISIWGSRTAASLKASDHAAGVSSGFYALSKTFRQILQVLIMAWAAWLVLAGHMSGGLIFFASMISGKALGPIEQLTGGWDQLSKAVTAFHNIEDITGEDKSLQARPNLPDPKGFLVGDSLVYHPENLRDPVIDQVSLVVRPGEMVVITGASGTGKSVLLRLLSGALKPSAGLIRLDNAEMSLWPAAQWGKNVGYLAQDVELFPGTIAANIGRFDPALDMPAVYEAAKRAGAHEMILKIPGGYQAPVAAGVIYLSSSQKQRIALARAFYGDPRVLVLDQPSTNMDQAGEGMLMNRLAEAKSRSTAIIVASQRTAMMRIADRAFLLKDGRLEALEIPGQRQAAQQGAAQPGQSQQVAAPQRAEAPSAAPFAEAG